MKSVKFFLIAISIFFSLFIDLAQASDDAIDFNIDKRTHATVTIKEHEVSYNVIDKGGEHRGEIPIETETKIHIDVDDYAFKGKNGFSIWYMDEGMGTYTIHRIFLFSKKYGKFMERFPSCGDEFINLKIDKKNKFLTSTYYNENVPKTCTTRLN